MRAALRGTCRVLIVVFAICLGTVDVARGAGLQACPDDRGCPAEQDHEHDHAAQEKKPAAQPDGNPEHADHDQGGESNRRPGVPPITDADRAAAFPDVRGHAVHDQAINYLVLFDTVETRAGRAGGVHWENTGWIGRDLDRVWFRTKGDADEGRLDHASVDVLYGRAIAPWWDVVVGIRQDFRPGPSRTWLAVGLQGLSRYWFDLEATAYLGAGGRTFVRLEGDYDLLVTNRIVAQPTAGVDLAGTSDRDRGIGAGLSSMDAGIRVRYELRRELAPYVGVTWSRKFFGTADLAEAAGKSSDGTSVAWGVRIWF